MGGPLSAQSADLHTLWGIKTKSKKMRDVGVLTISDEGFPVWVRGQDCFSLAQFRDNVLIASSLHSGTHTTLVQDISSVLSEIWQLEVVPFVGRKNWNLIDRQQSYNVLMLKVPGLEEGVMFGGKAL